jgi:hypothetical protein
MPRTTSTSSHNDKRLSLDTWAVIVALVLTLAVKFGILSKVPW